MSTGGYRGITAMPSLPPRRPSEGELKLNLGPFPDAFYCSQKYLIMPVSKLIF